MYKLQYGGETETLESLIENNYNQLYACAYRLVGNHADAEDVLQNAFLKAYKNIHQFQWNSKLSTWVFRIIVNESYRFFKTIKNLPIVRIAEDLGMSEREFFEGIAYTPDFDDQLIMDEMREKCLHAFLRCVPKRQRVCFLLKTCLNLKIQEIAEVLEITPENVKVSLYRGRKKLQELFEMRCSLINPEKPCKCQLWIKYMKDHQLPLPTGYEQPKTEALKLEHFAALSFLRKIDFLYTVEAKLDKKAFYMNLKKAVELL